MILQSIDIMEYMLCKVPVSLGEAALTTQNSSNREQALKEMESQKTALDTIQNLFIAKFNHISATLNNLDLSNEKERIKNWKKLWNKSLDDIKQKEKNQHE